MINDTIKSSESYGDETQTENHQMSSDRQTFQVSEMFGATALSLSLAICSVCFIFFNYHKALPAFLVMSGIFMLQGVWYIPNVINNSSLRVYFCTLFVLFLILGSIIFSVVKFY